MVHCRKIFFALQDAKIVFLVAICAMHVGCAFPCRLPLLDDHPRSRMEQVTFAALPDNLKLDFATVSGS